MATIVAAACTQSAVQAAITAASSGDKVLIPNGSFTATAGFDASGKQLLVGAENYTPTPGGNATRNVAITHSAGTDPLFSFTTGNSHHCGIFGLRFNEGTGTGNHVRFNGSGSKIGLLADCFHEVKQRNGTSFEVSVISWNALGGLMWNTRLVGLAAGTSDGVGPDGACMTIFSPRSWLTASTMGALDTDGSVNVYAEDCAFINVHQCPDIDDGGRYVARYSTIDGTSGLTHGYTSNSGGRHFEYYNNVLSVTNVDRNLTGRYFWARMGHGVFVDNTVNNAANPGGYGTPVALQAIVENLNDGVGTYPRPRQPGWGHNGSIAVLDPIYLHDAGARANTWSNSDSYTNTYVQASREIYTGLAKPSYSKYAYPHPARAALAGGIVLPASAWLRAGMV
jgi:hypothetical protein